jgi:hypothetical protein
MRDAGSAPVRFERREMSVGAAIEPNHGKIETVIRTDDLAIALCRVPHSQPRRAYRKRIEKFTSCNHRFSLSLVFCRSQAFLSVGPTRNLINRKGQPWSEFS